MGVLLLFACIAGVITVLSPCILPILPALLASGTLQRKMRPLGVIVGLVASFAFFTLALAALIRITGISPTILRYGAISLLFFFGLVMLFPSLSNWFARITAGIANAGQKIQKEPKKGFWGGVAFGIPLGLLWTPCAGPILAAITTLVATREITQTAVLMTIAYSFGAAIPLLLIAYGSSKAIEASRFLSKHAEAIRRVFGGVMILLSVVLALHWEMLLEQRLLRYLPTSLVENHPRLEAELKKLQGETPVKGKAPELQGISNWINSPPLTLEQLKGKVVLIDFWTYSCINCLRTLPYLEKWDKAYRDKGLVIIGVHTPEFAFEKDVKNVSKAAQQLGVSYPIALDNEYGTWNAYNNRYWPAHYLIDQDGNIRMVHFGEGAYMETENAIRSLLGLSPLMMSEESKQSRLLTPEIYLGTQREANYTPEIVLKPGKVTDYSFVSPLGNDQVGLKGRWLAEEEYLMAAGNDSFLYLNFLAKQVYLVASGKSSLPLEVMLDGKTVKTITIEEDRKYDVVETSYGRHQLAIKVPQGIKVYTFTFGND